MDVSSRIIQKLFSTYQDELFEQRQPLKNHKAVRSITRCRTRDMGVSYYGCSNGHKTIEQFHSCRHRSCYLCAQKQRVEWIEQQKQRLLDVPHFHVIFTLPHEYLSLWRYNEALFSRLLFTASQQTLFELLADSKYGGVIPGVLMALHTWGRQLTLHPHTHCLVSAGGLDHSGEWKELSRYLLPGGVIRRVYRGKVQALLKAALETGDLELPPDLTVAAFWRQYRELYKKDWSVRIEERYEHGKGVALYLARYCKGGPLDPRQIRRCSSDEVQMTYLDHRDKRTKMQNLRPKELLQRLLQHVPPSGLHTVRYYGLYASASRNKHRSCVERLGTLAGHQVAYSERLREMVLYCQTCGERAGLLAQAWPRRKKEISINKEAGRLGANGSVQQGVEADIAGQFIDSS
jgi:hypothetical protein